MLFYAYFELFFNFWYFEGQFILSIQNRFNNILKFFEFPYPNCDVDHNSTKKFENFKKCNLSVLELGVYEERAGGSCPWNYQGKFTIKTCSILFTYNLNSLSRYWLYRKISVVVARQPTDLVVLYIFLSRDRDGTCDKQLGFASFWKDWRNYSRFPIKLPI